VLVEVGRHHVDRPMVRRPPAASLGDRRAGSTPV
jgi:hypothetical protein